MVQTIFFIAGSPVNPPKNWQGLGVELNYGIDQFPNAGTVTITDFEWVRENYDYLKKYIDDGLTGGVGIMEGPSLRIDISDGTTAKTIFNGFIDLTNHKIKDRTSITAKAVSHATVDWLNQVASGFTFEYLASDDFKKTGQPGYIDKSMYRFMPYVNNQVPNYEQAAIATLMIYSVEQQIEAVINEIADLTINLASPFTAANGILQAIIKVGYLSVLLITMIQLIRNIYKFIISPVKYHAGMYVRDLFNSACQYLNMNFVSDIWSPGSPYYNEFIIPEKLFNAPVADSLISGSGLLGFLNPDQNEQIGFYKGTFAQLIGAMKTKYNAKIVVSVPAGGATASNQGTITLIRRDKNAVPPAYQLPDVYNPEYTYNVDELPSNYLIEYQTDSTDTNTLQNYQGTIFQVICQPIAVNYRPFAMFKNFVDVPIPFARATKKTSLTVPEKLMDSFFHGFDAIANVIVKAVNLLGDVVRKIINLVRRIFKFFRIPFSGGNISKMQPVNLSLGIENRVGMMQLSSDHFNAPKILILKEGSQSKYNKIASTNDYDESGEAMWKRFHYVSSFIPRQLNPSYVDRPFGNQYKIQQFSSIPFTWSDLIKVVSNNYIFGADGSPAVIESLKFYPSNPGESGKADIKVRFRKIFTLNIKESFLNPTGA